MGEAEILWLIVIVWMIATAIALSLRVLEVIS